MELLTDGPKSLPVLSQEIVTLVSISLMSSRASEVNMSVENIEENISLFSGITSSVIETPSRVATKILRGFWGRAADTGSMNLQLLLG